MSIPENRQKILNDIKTLNPDAGLIAVSKKQPLMRIEQALKTGHRVYGENRIQEAIQRWEPLRATYADLELHLIGPLQTNKVSDAVRVFDVIQTLDREKLATSLSKEMKKQNRPLSCFIQVNTGEEDQKSGILPSQLPEFLDYCRNECELNITGLMCIPPLIEPPALHFALLKKLAKHHNLVNLSMGMSSDYQKALALGATHIRVGTDFFGKRDQ